MKIYLSILLLVSCIQVYAQELKTIKIKDQAATYETRNFHIVAVTDNRVDTTTIGTIRAGLTGKKVNVNLQGGTAAAIKQFIEKNVTQNKAATPINIHVTQLQVHEKMGGLTDEAIVDISMAFYLQDQLLIEYSGTASQQASINAGMFIEGLVRKNINESLERFDDWWVKHKSQYNTNGKMVPATIKVSVEEGTTNGDPTLILYSTKRPLTLADFKGAPDDQNPGAAAITYSGISVAFNGQLLNGVATLKIVVTPTFSTAKSWCRVKNRDAHTLNHEQKHFDLTGLKACELMAAIKNYPFTPEHYEQELDALREKALKELDEEQNLYDRQSNHGLIPAEQERWNKDINKRLLQQVCY